MNNAYQPLISFVIVLLLALTFTTPTQATPITIGSAIGVTQAVLHSSGGTILTGKGGYIAGSFAVALNPISPFIIVGGVILALVSVSITAYFFADQIKSFLWKPPVCKTLREHISARIINFLNWIGIEGKATCRYK